MALSFVEADDIRDDANEALDRLGIRFQKIASMVNQERADFDRAVK